ncbi:hypothetical protein SAMN00120144_3832 [Hymenobacter roseosalivarius DSM 11622]|uniref:Uncharacterized protein n=1 Tax=Hymenobacter roseosalivarius DSM 11622 TaxID=645990 RepID=A0A1W1VZ40_9BACT|nr:hypothetical protein SAMN00120144_3832 [Hymenobacter roseosalivarius DSM 11622]
MGYTKVVSIFVARIFKQLHFFKVIQLLSTFLVLIRILLNS